MKSLRESIQESVDKTNESLFGAALGLSVAKLICLLAMAEVFIYSGRGGGGYTANSFNPIDHIKAEGGAPILGIFSWLLHLGESLTDKIRDEKMRRYIDRLKNSEEFKAYLELPKRKQTLKELERIAKEVCNIDDSRPARRIWDEIKKGAPADVQNVEITE